MSVFLDVDVIMNITLVFSLPSARFFTISAVAPQTPIHHMHFSAESCVTTHGCLTEVLSFTAHNQTGNLIVCGDTVGGTRQTHYVHVLSYKSQMQKMRLKGSNYRRLSNPVLYSLQPGESTLCTHHPLGYRLGKNPLLVVLFLVFR